MSDTVEIQIERDRSYFPVRVFRDNPAVGIYDGPEEVEYALTEAEEQYAMECFADRDEPSDWDQWNAEMPRSKAV